MATASRTGVAIGPASDDGIADQQPRATVLRRHRSGLRRARSARREHCSRDPERRTGLGDGLPGRQNGGQVDPPGGVAGGGVLQAATEGGAVTYDSATSFGPDAAGAPVASQYLAIRVGESWATQNLT